MRYAGLGMQFLIAIALGIFLGLKMDGWLNISIPLLVWLLPLIIICAIIFKIVRETSSKK